MHSPESSPYHIQAGPPAQAIDRAQELCLTAEVLVADSRRRRSERRRWQAVWKACCASPDHIMTCCSYCRRVRGPEGEWGVVPSEVNQALYRQTSNGVQLSHGVCPDCAAINFPR